MALDDDLSLLREELAGLREPDRTAVTLHHLLGQDIDSVASTLGCSPGATRMRIARALETLRARLGGRGVALGLAALVTALREAPAITVPAAPSQAALLLIHSPLVPTTSITLASGVAVMATTAGCASAVLATVLAWNYGVGADQTPAPTPPPAKPPVVAPDPSATTWVDRPLGSGDSTLGEIPAVIIARTGHPVVTEINWQQAVHGQGEPFPLTGQTPRTAIAHLAASVNAAWLLVEDQVIISSKYQIRAFQLPIAPPTNRADLEDLHKILSYLQIASQLNIVVDPSVVAQGPQIAKVAWNAPLSTVDILGLLAHANGWICSWRNEAFLISRDPASRPLLDDAPRLVLRGQPWIPVKSPLDQPVDFDAQDWPGSRLAEELTKQTGIPIAWPAGTDGATITLKVKKMRLRDALTWVAKITNTTLTEPEIGKRLAFVR